MPLTRLSALIFIILAALSMKTGFKLDTAQLQKKAQHSLGLGMPVKNMNRVNPFAPKDPKEEPSVVNPSLIQQNNKPKPIVIAGGKPGARGPTGIVDIFEEDDREDPVIGGVIKNPRIRGNVVPKGEAELKNDQRPLGKDTVPTKPIETGIKEPAVVDPKNLSPATKQVYDFSKMGKNFIIPFGTPGGFLKPNFNLPPFSGGKVGPLPGEKGADDNQGGKQSPVKEKEPQLVQPTVQEVSPKIGDKKLPEIPAGKTYQDASTQTDAFDGEDRITEDDLKSPKDKIGGNDSPQIKEGDQQPHIVITKPEELPNGPQDKTPLDKQGGETPQEDEPSLFDLLDVETTKGEQDEDSEEDENRDVVNKLTTITRSRSENDFVGEDRRGGDAKFSDDTDIDYGNIFLSIHENDLNAQPFDRNFVRRPSRIRPSIRISGSRTPLSPSYIRNQPNQKLRKVKRIYLIEVVRCAKCQEDPLVSDFVGSSF